MTEDGNTDTVNVAARGYPDRSGMEDISTHTQGKTDTWVIGLLDTLWNVVEAIIVNRQRASIRFHDALHGFCAGRGMGIAILELKISQELASGDQDPLFLVFWTHKKPMTL